MFDWAGLNDAQRLLARVNAIRKGAGLPRKDLEDLGVAVESDVCQKCGCTESNACEGIFGGGCHWVDKARTKCSECFAVDGQLFDDETRGTGPRAEPAGFRSVKDKRERPAEEGKRQ